MKKNYKTKQRQIITELIKETAGKHITVDEIYIKLKEKGIELGKATVYRQINDMVRDGQLKKYNTEFGRSACFEYIQEKDSSIYHFKCTDCNELIHVNCPSLGEVKSHLLEEHGFKIDTSKVIFVGECENCRRKSSKNK